MMLHLVVPVCAMPAVALLCGLAFFWGLTA